MDVKKQHLRTLDWVKVMEGAIRSVAVRLCARRMVKEYVQEYYVKAFGKA